MAEQNANATSLKQMLSKANHRWKWNRRSRKATRRVMAAMRQPGAPALADVQKLLTGFAPWSTGHDLIRIGPDFDGGYLVPNDLDDLDALFSPGVSDTLGFDLEMAATGLPAHLADASVDRPLGLIENMTFTPKFIGPENNETFMTMDSWVQTHAPGEKDLLLQMDIEGAEYDVLNGIPDQVLNRFRVILLEIHDLDRLFEPKHFQTVQRTVEKLNQFFVVCHVHANNTAPYFDLAGQRIPPVIELSYIRRDRVNEQSPIGAKHIPHMLDQINEPKLPDPGMSAFWETVQSS